MKTEITTRTQGSINEKLICIKHKSGLCVYCMPKEFSNTYALIGARCGGIDCTIPYESGNADVPLGMAHFLEHKLFANKDGVDTCEKFNAVGASCNAYTSFDITAYLFSCRNENVMPSLRVLLESYFEPYFTKENVRNEASIISEEVKMYRDDPGDCLNFALMSAMFDTKAIHVSPCGTVKSVKSITPQVLSEYYRYFYRPSNSILCICGKVNPEEIVTLLDGIVPQCGFDEGDVPHFYTNESDGVKRKSLHLKRKLPYPIFNIGVKLPYNGDTPRERMKLDIAYSLLCEEYFSGSNPFISGFYERGETSSPLKYSLDSVANGICMLIVDGESENAKSIAHKIRSYIKEIPKNLISEERLKTLKNIVYSHYLRVFDSTEEAANEILSYAAADCDIFALPELLSEIDLTYLSFLQSKAFVSQNITSAIME